MTSPAERGRSNRSAPVEVDYQALFSVKITQIQMLRDRGYQITDNEAAVLTLDLDGFIDYYTKVAELNKCSFRSALTSVYTTPDGGKRAIVYYARPPAGKNLTTEEVNLFISTFSAETPPYDTAILITPLTLIANARERLELLITVSIEVFLDKQLVSNVTHNKWVPQHELVPAAEVPDLLKRLRATFNQLPIIKKDDPVVRYYGWRPGGIVKIYRKMYVLDVLCQSTIFYRAIV